jgi:hypothetical protein
VFNSTPVEFAFTPLTDVSNPVRVGSPKYIAFDPDIPSTPHDYAEPFRAYLRQHYNMEKRFVIWPNGFTQELWAAPMTTSAVA